MEKLLPEAIDHIKNVSKKKLTTERLLACINKSSPKFVMKWLQKILFVYSPLKNMIDENLLLSGKSELVDYEISPSPLPGRHCTKK